MAGDDTTASELLRSGQPSAAAELWQRQMDAGDTPAGPALLGMAKAALAEGHPPEALNCLARLVRASDDFRSWTAAARLLGEVRAQAPASRPPVRVGLLSTYTVDQLRPLLELAGAGHDLDFEVHTAPFDQYHQQILDPSSALYRSEPDAVVLAPHAGASGLPDHTDDPDAAVQQEAEVWTSRWATLVANGVGRIVQHTFAAPYARPFGHLTAKVPGSRAAMLDALNRRLAEAAGDEVALVDSEALSAWYGKERWFDDRYWFHAKQAVALGALPLLARHTAAVLAAQAGRTRKCLVLDLDNTLWGGVVGDDGVDALLLGDGPRGEAFAAFQREILALKARGVLLAVASKNDEATARAAFDHPGMVLSVDDVTAFAVNWDPKPHNLRELARRLDIGTNALVFVDDNPAEREIVRRELPEVHVLDLPPDPARYARVLANYTGFESAAFTDEDRAKTQQYRARAQAGELRARAGSLEDFQRDLKMVARAGPVDEATLPRVAQLIGKTNQFNLTTRRRSLAEVRALLDDPKVFHRWVRVEDRLADHGLVAVLLAFERGEVLDVDTWLMSCRVIGRSVERTALELLVEHAQRRGLARIEGTYVPTTRNGLVADLYADLGFQRVDEAPDGTTRWALPVPDEPVRNPIIELEAA